MPLRFRALIVFASVLSELVACRNVGLDSLLDWTHSSAWIVVITTHFLQSPDASSKCVKSWLENWWLQALLLRAERTFVVVPYGSDTVWYV